nr:papain-like cysteine protease family protein [Mucilaginibacter oryzae]
MGSLAPSYPVERQLMHNWCWAATAVSLRRFYRDMNIPNQQQFVAQVTQRGICASGPLNPYCDLTHDLGDAVYASGHLSNPYPSALIPNDVINFIQGGARPIVCQMYLPQGSLGIGIGHAVSIISAQPDNQGGLSVWVADPGDAAILHMSYNQLRSNYRNWGGQWLRSYTTH